MTILKLEGKLSGPWVEELDRCWREISASRRVQLVLEAVTFIDSGGKKLLARMYQDGAELVATGCMTKAIVEEVKQSLCDD